MDNIKINALSNEINAFIQTFRKMFHAKFGTYPVVQYDFTSFNYGNITLKELYELINSKIFNEKDALKKKIRSSKYSLYRHVFCKIGRDLKYSTGQVGVYIGRDHATVIYASKKVNNMLAINDKITVDAFSYVKTLITEYIQQNAEDIQND